MCAIGLETHSNIGGCKGACSVGHKTLCRRGKLEQFCRFHPLSEGSTYSKDDAHGSHLATFEYAIDLLYVRLVVHDPSVDFNPGMGLKRKYLSADQEPCVPAAAS